MLDLPIGSSLVAVETNGKHTDIYSCTDCCFFIDRKISKCDGVFACLSGERKDSKNVIFKIIDLKDEYDRGYVNGVKDLEKELQKGVEALVAGQKIN